MTPSFNYGVPIVAYNTYKHHRINFTFPQHEFTIRQIIIYPSVYRQFRLCITNASGKAHVSTHSKFIYKAIDAKAFWTDLNYHTTPLVETKVNPKKMLFLFG